MKWLYLLLNISSVFVPFLFSFHPKLKFYKKFKSLAIAIAITSTFFIIWDVIFTQHKIWGFNESYFLGYRIFNLPIEEWLFFICIPFACVFMHYSLLVLMPNLKFPDRFFKIKVISSLVACLVICIVFYDKWYTLINFGTCFFVLLISYRYKRKLLQQFMFTFLFMLIPFFIVNGILTGSGIENEVVWYNNDENLRFRLFTIPFEDIFYAFSLILMNILIVDYLENKKTN